MSGYDQYSTKVLIPAIITIIQQHHLRVDQHCTYNQVCGGVLLPIMFHFISLISVTNPIYHFDHLKTLNMRQKHSLCKYKLPRACVKPSEQKHTSGSIPHAWNSFAYSVQITSRAPMLPLQEGRKTVWLRTLPSLFTKWPKRQTRNWTQGQVEFRGRFSEESSMQGYCFSTIAILLY